MGRKGEDGRRTDGLVGLGARGREREATTRARVEGEGKCSNVETTCQSETEIFEWVGDAQKVGFYFQSQSNSNESPTLDLFKKLTNNFCFIIFQHPAVNPRRTVHEK